ncbi:ArsR family transcriptional regulator [Stappia sp. BW2]|nr:ArsR family transcriptional regulator [Stappia sp. BW2]
MTRPAKESQVPKTTVLFVCPDNSLLSPLAEAYLNFRAGGLMRAFSAGVAPSQSLSRHVRRLLSARGIDADGLAPKPVGVFLMPHAEIPDRVVYLADQEPVVLPPQWKTTTSSHWWHIAAKPPFPEGFAACAAYFERIAGAIDRLVEPPKSAGADVSNRVA